MYDNDYTDAVMAPIYDVVCTTVYLPKDIPALKMSDGKLWWRVKTYRNFAQRTCGLKSKEIDEIIIVCKEAVKKSIGALNKYSVENPQTLLMSQKLSEIWSKNIEQF